MIALVFVNITIPAHAVQLDAAISKNSEEFIPTFQFTRIISIQYQENSELAKLIGDKQHEIIFDINSENASILIDKLNLELEKKSLVNVSSITGKYSTVIIPQNDSVTIEYKIILQPTMQNHFIKDSVAYLDSQWRGFHIQGEAIIDTEDFGAYDINSPKSSLQVALPNVLDYISEPSIIEILELEILDASGVLELPLSKWESMFDPTAKMVEKERYGFSGNVITNYSMGICTIYIGLCQDKDYQEEFTVNGYTYNIRSIESQDDATIVIEGYVKEDNIMKTEAFVVQNSAPGIGNENDIQVPTLYTVSGIGIIVAAGFFVWSNKKTRNTATEQTGIDPKNLCAVQIDSSAGGYQTNRVTARLQGQT